MDKSMAPAGQHTLHAYLPATEPFERWQGAQAWQIVNAEKEKYKYQSLLSFAFG